MKDTGVCTDHYIKKKRVIITIRKSCLSKHPKILEERLFFFSCCNCISFRQKQRDEVKISQIMISLWFFHWRGMLWLRGTSFICVITASLKTPRGVLNTGLNIGFVITGQWWGSGAASIGSTFLKFFLKKWACFKFLKNKSYKVLHKTSQKRNIQLDLSSARPMSPSVDFFSRVTVSEGWWWQ